VSRGSWLASPPLPLRSATSGQNGKSVDYISYGIQRIILLMIQRTVAAFAFLLFASFLVAQTAQSPTVQFPRLKITFGEGVPLKDVWLEYSLSGPGVQRREVGLGGPSQHFGHLPSGAQSYEIEASVDGYAVDQFKALVWAPGCKMKEFDITLSTSSVVLPYECDKTKSVTLFGRLQQVDWGIQSAISVEYVGPLGGFFSVCKDVCRTGAGVFVSIPEIATAEVGTDGTFKIELPDFGADAITSRANGGGEFQFLLRDIALAPGYPNYRTIGLEPDLEEFLGPRLGLKFAASYPSDLVFVPHKYNLKPSAASPNR
jgi:hypothetical protein